MRKQLKLRETITTPKLKGIFIKLGNANISDSDVFDFISDNKVTLNVDYYDIYSREKMASHYFNKQTNLDYVFIDTDDAVYIDDNDYVGIMQSSDDIYDELAKIIIMRFQDKWERVYKALVLEDYKALENYNMYEVRTPDLTDLRTLDLLKTLTKNSADNRTINTQNQRTANLHTDDKTAVNQNLDTTESTNRFGYNDNGTSGSPYEKKTSNVTGTGTNNYTDRDIDETGTDTMANTGTDNVAHTGYDTDADTGTDTLTHTGTETLERSGNIGVTTSQQMLESEIKLRALYNMVYIIYDDVDKVLTNPIFID